jgi:uncharacterized membrane protein YhaH (DUF805 family)
VEELNAVQWAVRPFTKFFDSAGRAPRAEYWWFFLFYLVVYVAASMIDMWLSLGNEDFGVLSTIWMLGCFLPQLMVSIRRLHDTGKPGWWLFMGIVPIVGFVLLFFMAQPGDNGTNESGPDPYGSDSLEEIFA